MEVTNQTPLAARIDDVSSTDGRRFGCLVAKATFALREGESRLDTQTPYGLFCEDVETELGILPNDQTPRHESAFDVMLLAAAYSDGNAPVPSRRVALEVGGHRRDLVVFGDRCWVGDRPSDPVPFTRMPLTWERAFGGSTLVEIDREAFVPVDYPLNPLGRGFDATESARIIAEALKAPSGYPKFTRDERLPNIEDAAEPLSSRNSTPLPACWAPAPPRVLAPIAPVLAELTENPAGVQESGAWQRFQRRCHPTWILSEPPAGRIRLVHATRSVTGVSVVPCRLFRTLSFHSTVSWSRRLEFEQAQVRSKENDGRDIEGGPPAWRSPDGGGLAHARRALGSRGTTSSGEGGKARVPARAGVADDGRRDAEQPSRVDVACARAHGGEMATSLPRRSAGGDASGRPSDGSAARSLSEADCARVVSEACRPPQDVGVPVTHWSISLLAEHLPSVGVCVSETSVRRILTCARLQPHRQKMWLHSQDDEFRDKRDALLRLYYETPADEHIICVDEKPGMQALERRYADVPMKPGAPVKREFEYIRHGTIALMGAFDVRAGKAFGFLAERTGGEPFVDLLAAAATCYPRGRGHFVCDNQSSHDTDDVLDWLEAHPRWTLHFTPKHASWLNQIEQFFSILQRRVIARGSFVSKQDLADKVTRYITWHNERGRPFRWTYRPPSWETKPPELRAA